MNELWRTEVADAFEAMHAALMSNKAKALEHLQDAIDKLHKAVEDLEAAEE